MILNAGDKKLKVIREVQKNEINDIYICKEEECSIVAYHTLWLVKRRAIAKKILKYEKYPCFSLKEGVCFLLPYEEPRPILNYFVSVAGEDIQEEDIYRDCVVQCMASDIPYPILYLILNQGQLYIAKDGSIHFGYLLNLEKISFGVTEKECAGACAELLCKLYSVSPKVKNKMAIRLLEQKSGNHVYHSFTELLSDVRMLAEKPERKKYIRQWKEGIVSKKDQLFRILCVISTIMIVVVLIIFLMKLFWGDTALYRLFAPAIERIGTESLLQ